ncbi:hypothetical protein [Chitinophaga defluvii]|uniref:Uncharacterized protein n=1 Tax=Chitinophaga defluvii TaxID=3163343 RepID=A0ABV2TD07_9BACT
MKRFKIGFAAIIAILAISATIASYAGAFKATKAAPATVADCYTNAAYLDPATGCSAVTLVNCPPASVIDKPIQSGFSNPVDAALACDGVQDVFCCARIKTGQPPLCGTTTRISAVFCKSAQP